MNRTASPEKGPHWRNAQRTAAAIRRHYLSRPGKTDAGWAEVLRDPAKFNRVWRHWLGLPASDLPPDSADPTPRSDR